jgi:hypothetical protein
MKRETSLILTLGLLSAFTPSIFAQDLHGRPDPVPPAKIVGPQLVAWSQLQQPQPIPQPEPEPGQDNRPADQKISPATPPVQQQPPDADSAPRQDGAKNQK